MTMHTKEITIRIRWDNSLHDNPSQWDWQDLLDMDEMAPNQGITPEATYEDPDSAEYFVLVSERDVD